MIKCIHNECQLPVLPKNVIMTMKINKEEKIMTKSVITSNLRSHLDSLKDKYGNLYETSIVDIVNYLNHLRVPYKIEIVTNSSNTGGIVNLLYENSFIVWEILFTPKGDN